MTRFFVTGDTHGDYDISKVSTRRWPLQKELCKSLRGEVSIDRIAEELADVEIMLWQVQRLFGIEDKYVQEVINFKLSRLKERLEREEQNEKTEPPLR